MKVFLAGGTGVVGMRALPALVAAGHQVTALARSDDKAAVVQRLGGRAARVDLFDAAMVKDAVDGHEAVVNLATSIPPMRKAVRSSAWAMNERIRSDGCSNLVAAARATGAMRYVQESICFPYVDAGAAWVTEDSPLDYPDGYKAAASAEAAALGFAAAAGVGVVLRFAQFYAPEASHTQTFTALLRKRINPFIGKAGAYASFIHAEDAASAVVAALTLPSGTYNVGDDTPMTRLEAGAAAAAAMGLKRPWRLPGSGITPRRVEMLGRSVRVANAKLASFGWAPTYPSIAEGWGR